MSKKAIILFTVFIDVLGVGIVIPTLPFYVESFGVSALVVTMLFMVYSLFSFFSAPILGAVSDKVGRRPVLLISVASTALGWLIFAAARSVPVLFLGRIIDGLAAGNFSTAQSYLVDLSKNDRERTVNLGQIGAIFGVGFIIGPTLGGFLGTVSPTLPFWFVGILAAANTVLAWFNLPETHLKSTGGSLDINPFRPILQALKDKKMLPGLTAFFLFGVAIAAQQSVFALYLDKVFNYGPFTAGIFMTGVGILLAINQGLLLKRFWLKHFAEPVLELAMLLVLALGFFLLSVAWLPVFIMGMVGLTFGQSVLRVVMTSQMLGESSHKHGEILGLMTSVMSLSMIVGPAISGPVFVYHPGSPFIISGILAVTAFLLVYINRRRLGEVIPAEETTPNFLV